MSRVRVDAMSGPSPMAGDSGQGSSRSGRSLTQPESGHASDTPLRAVGLSKSYAGVQALEDVDLELFAGEIHGLCGANGSGKSTLLGILSGQVRPDRGRITVNGHEARLGDAAAALASGIATVTQETTLVDELSVAENIFLGPRKPRSWRGIDWRETRRRAEAVLARLELDIDPMMPVGRLRPDGQQMVEIARAIATDARVLILDEPTSSLTDDAAEVLFGVVRTLKSHGVAVVFVTHRMSELFDVVDRITVLRDGRRVGGGPSSGYTEHSLVHEMTGRELAPLELETRTPRVFGESILRLDGLSVPGRVDDARLDVGRGEVVGLTGLAGAGRSDLLDALFGLSPDAVGAVTIDGVDGLPKDPVAAMRRGIAYVPADRKRHGLVLDMSVGENMLMAKLSSRWRLGRPRRATESVDVREATVRFGVKAASSGMSVRHLSGGNQQKVVLAKWLATSPSLLLLDEPTRGVDIAAKFDVYRLLQTVREAGVTILVNSSEVPELLLLCDRILVMHRGQVTAELSRTEADEATITRLAMGHDA